MPMPASPAGELKFLLYPCNAVGYLRLGLVAAAVTFWHTSTRDAFTTNLIFVATLGSSSLLDIVDGYLARRFRHETYFGKMLDQSTDLVTSSVAWIASGSMLAGPILLLEWSTGLSVVVRELPPMQMGRDVASGRLHRRKRILRRRLDGACARPLGAYRFIDAVPCVGWLACRYFANRQRNALSAVANVSHFSYPMALILGVSFHWAAYLCVPGLVVFEIATAIILVAAWTRVDSGGADVPSM